MSAISKKLILIVIAFLVILAGGTIAVLKIAERWGGGEGAKEETFEGPFVDNVVNYTDKGFMPQELSIALERGLGCAVRVVNRTDESVKIGLSPHGENDPGAQYPPIEPGGNLLFDPRYSGFTELRLHNHEEPGQEFLVKFESSCR